MTFTERYVHTGQIALNVAEWDAPSPEAPTMVLVHGYGSSWQTWGRVVDKLSTMFHLFAIDLRAMGRSGRLLPGVERQAWVDDVAAALPIISDKPVILVGHSLGGWIIASLASQHPDLVSKLILNDPYSGAHSEVREQERQERHEQKAIRADQIQAARTPEDLAPMVAARYGVVSEFSTKLIAMNYFQLDHVVERLRSNPAEDHDMFEGMFRAIQCPVLLIRGAVDKGGIMSDEEADRVIDLIPDAQHLSWPRVGHSPHIARNHDFIRATKRFCGG
jgi:2-hydroxy-6-oxonona-2,4-dienedioate hydrolase